MIGELSDRERDELVRLNYPGQRHQEQDGKTGNDSFHVELTAGSSRSLCLCLACCRHPAGGKEAIA